MGLCLDKNSDTKFVEKAEEPLILSQLDRQDDRREIAQAIAISCEEDKEDLQQEPKHKKTLSDFNLIRVLGRGSFGKVMLVESKKSKRLYAMKILRKEIIAKSGQKEHTMNEKMILQTLRHPFMVRLHYAFQTSTKLYFIMDFMIGGELFFHLRKFRLFKEQQAKFYSAELVLAIEYLHKHGVIYRDLKPENILIGEDGHLKITDFGLSKLNLRDNEKTNTFCGTPEYIAPEILLRKGHTKSVDWYSLEGALLYEFLAGAPPFYSRDKNIIMKNKLEKPLEMKPWFGPEACNILEGLLQKDPSLRLGKEGAEQIKSHAFFSEIDWDHIYKKLIEPPFKPKVYNPRDLNNFHKMFTDETVQDTPVANRISQDTYNNFSYVRKNTEVCGSQASYPHADSKSQLQNETDKFVEINENFGLLK